MKRLFALSILLIVAGCGSPSITELQAQRDVLAKERSRLMAHVAIFDAWESASEKADVNQQKELTPAVEVLRNGEFIDTVHERKKAELEKISKKLVEVDETLARLATRD